MSDMTHDSERQAESIEKAEELPAGSEASRVSAENGSAELPASTEPSNATSPVKASEAAPPETASQATASADPATAKRATRALTNPPPVKLEAYEGPLDLLLDLIRKQEIDIYDIPIARITKQYLDYLHLMDELNIDLGGEFVFMAATLIYIKSRLLLPPDPNAPPEDLEDPRTELVHRLIEHEQFKNAAQMLQSKLVLEEAMWSEPGIGEFSEAEDEPGLAVSVFELISAFREILERAKQRTPLAIVREEVSVAEMIEHVRDVLRSRRGGVRLDDLAEGFLSRQALVALLLALLELVRLQAVHLRQKELFAPITIDRSKHFEEVMSGANRMTLEAALEESENIG
jgi:segregation and condensation protein A